MASIGLAASEEIKRVRRVVARCVGRLTADGVRRLGAGKGKLALRLELARDHIRDGRIGAPKRPRIAPALRRPLASSRTEGGRK
jgi:hypothetical protein